MMKLRERVRGLLARGCWWFEFPKDGMVLGGLCTRFPVGKQAACCVRGMVCGYNSLVSPKKDNAMGLLTTLPPSPIVL